MMNLLIISKIIIQNGTNSNSYADDTLLYLSISPEESNLLGRLQAWVKFLLLNSDETEQYVVFNNGK